MCAQGIWLCADEHGGIEPDAEEAGGEACGKPDSGANSGS